MTKPQHFTSFSPKIFWQFFSWNQSCQQLKSSKPQHFHYFFTQKIDDFLGKPKVEFLDKRLRFRTVWKSAGKFKFPNSCSEYHHFIHSLCFSFWNVNIECCTTQVVIFANDVVMRLLTAWVSYQNGHMQFILYTP